MNSSLLSHTGFWLRSVSNHVSHSFARKLRDSSVTGAEWVVLRQMYDGASISPSVLAEQTGMTRGAASKLIDRLFAKNLVTREERAGDRRYQDIALTAAGRRLVPTLTAIADRNDREAFSPLSAREHKALRAILKKLAQAHDLHKIPTE
jgi:DNA-binding MarR family transcriptional regulator